MAAPTASLPEEMEPATGAFLGNMPLLFSHAEYLKAVLEPAQARPLDKLSLMASQVLARLRRWLPPPRLTEKET